MTALNKYERLEAAGLWRAEPGAQSVNVYISMGDASLTITDLGGRPMGHWSLAAIERRNPGKRPAVFFPAGDPGQSIELGEDASPMIEALEQVRTAIGRKRPHPGRLRLMTLAGSFAAVAGLMAFWLPDVVRDHVARVLPEVTRAEIGMTLQNRIGRVTGPACNSGDGQQALVRLAGVLPAETRPKQIQVVRNGVRSTLALPGGTILTGRVLVEDYEDPDVFTGFVVAETLYAAQNNPLRAVLDKATVWEALRLLTTGTPPEPMLARYAEHALTATPSALEDELMLQGFRAAGLRTTPYAYAVDMTGETVLGLIEADPFAGETPASLLSDADWLRLQGICGT
ncbi:MAG: hypothetical protein AAGA28_12225 [Pseudomonadota bacterium]